MAIHKVVLGTADGRWRIESDRSGTAFRVEHDGSFAGKFASLSALVEYLAKHGVDIADLIER